MSYPADRLPPQNLDAEISVLGSILLDASAVPVVRALLRPEDMHSPDHSVILTALYEMADDAAPHPLQVEL